MLGKTYDRENCSAARALEVVGERWSLLIIRDALFRGETRFVEFQRSLGVAPNILASRLAWFVESGVMEMTTASEGSSRTEYRLTSMGRDLGPVVVALTAWGDRWSAPDGPPVSYRHRHCGGNVQQRMTCSLCGEVMKSAEIEARPRRRPEFN